eukprot:Hpha_TRINITY_DN15761_c6_g7::TRINITY_DN15761_c6_g7_i1::g.38599::m.38599
MAYYASSDAEYMLFEQHCMFSPEYYYPQPSGGADQYHRARVGSQQQRRPRTERNKKSTPRVHASTPDSEHIVLPPIEEILREVGMDKYAAALKEQGIFGAADIKKIDEDLLRKVGLKQVPRLKLLRHVAGYMNVAAKKALPKMGLDDSCCGSSIGPSEADSMSVTQFSEAGDPPRSPPLYSSHLQPWSMGWGDWMHHHHHHHHHYHHFNTYQQQQQQPHATAQHHHHQVHHHHHHHHQAVFGTGPMQPEQPVPEADWQGEPELVNEEEPILLSKGSGRADLQSPSSWAVDTPQTGCIAPLLDEDEDVHFTPSSDRNGRWLRRADSLERMDDDSPLSSPSQARSRSAPPAR